jgi:hypothetical protein
LISDAALARASYSSGRLRLIRGAFCGMLDDAHSRSNAVTVAEQYADPLANRVAAALDGLPDGRSEWCQCD